MTIYIDSDYKCYVSTAEGRRAIETDAFTGKCDDWIESFRFIPPDESWVRDDGMIFRGEMISPWRDLSDAYAAQAAYLTTLTGQYEAALTEIEAALGVTR